MVRKHSRHVSTYRKAAEIAFRLKCRTGIANVLLCAPCISAHNRDYYFFVAYDLSLPAAGKGARQRFKANPARAARHRRHGLRPSGFYLASRFHGHKPATRTVYAPSTRFAWSGRV